MAKRRSAAQLARDRRRIAELYLRGWLQVDIADEIGIDQSTVSRDLSTLQDEWKEAALMDLNEAKSQELAKVDQLEREYWDAWERSKEDAETITEKGKGKPTSKPNEFEKTVQRKGQTGDPSFLRGVQWCINKRCEILGLDAPKRQELTGADGDKLKVEVEYVNSPIKPPGIPSGASED